MKKKEGGEGEIVEFRNIPSTMDSYYGNSSKNLMQTSQKSIQKQGIIAKQYTELNSTNESVQISGSFAF